MRHADTPAERDHPDSALLASFLEGRLTGATRAAVVAHLALCGDCRELLGESAAVLQGFPDPRGLHVIARRRTIAIAGAALAAAATILVAFGLLRSRGTAGDLQQLVTAIGTHRVIEPRLTGGFAWGPLPPVMRSGVVPRELPPGTRITLAEVEDRTQARGDAAALSVGAVAALLSGRVEVAIDRLQQALRVEPDNPRLHSDLAAAFLVRGAPADVSVAATHAARAVALAPELVEGWFNLALARERSGDVAAARQAWEQCLARDAGSDWGREVRTRLSGS